jgi:hypothetical protein
MSNDETPAERPKPAKQSKPKARAKGPGIAPKSHPVTDFITRTKDVLRDRFANILDAIAEKSVEGSLPHAKYLFELAGLREEFVRQVQGDGEPTLAEVLLAEVTRHREEATPATEGTEMALNGTRGAQCDGPEPPSSDYGAKGQ